MDKQKSAHENPARSPEEQEKESVLLADFYSQPFGREYSHGKIIESVPSSEYKKAGFILYEYRRLSEWHLESKAQLPKPLLCTLHGQLDS